VPPSLVGYVVGASIYGTIVTPPLYLLLTLEKIHSVSTIPCEPLVLLLLPSGDTLPLPLLSSRSVFRVVNSTVSRKGRMSCRFADPNLDGAA
jgi:hypothetical protein